MGDVVYLNQKQMNEDIRMGMALKADRRRVDVTTETKRIIGHNIDLLWKKKNWTQQEPRGRTIERHRKNQGNPTLESLEFVAKKAGILVWYLLIPGMDDAAISSRELELVVSKYLQTPEKRNSIKDMVIALSK